jgi:hypothetical protein
MIDIIKVTYWISYPLVLSIGIDIRHITRNQKFRKADCRSIEQIDQLNLNELFHKFVSNLLQSWKSSRDCIDMHLTVSSQKYRQLCL